MLKDSTSIDSHKLSGVSFVYGVLEASARLETGSGLAAGFVRGSSADGFVWLV